MRKKRGEDKIKEAAIFLKHSSKKCLVMVELSSIFPPPLGICFFPAASLAVCGWRTHEDAPAAGDADAGLFTRLWQRRATLITLLFVVGFCSTDGFVYVSSRTTVALIATSKHPLPPRPPFNPHPSLLITNRKTFASAMQGIQMSVCLVRTAALQIQHPLVVGADHIVTEGEKVAKWMCCERLPSKTWCIGKDSESFHKQKFTGIGHKVTSGKVKKKIV